MAKHEKPVKTGTLDRRDQNRAASAQKQPYKSDELHKFDKGLHSDHKGQHPKR